MPEDSIHILVLTDRDWTHPQAGDAGANLLGQISRWLAWGHRVTVVTSSSPGADAEERIDNLAVHRMGGPRTVVPRAIWKLRRGLVPDADVVLEVNGTTFLTPLWLRLPRHALSETDGSSDSDAAARRTLDELAELRAAGSEVPSLRSQLSGSDTGRAAGLAGAVMVANVVGLVFTIAFARILGTGDYGTLAALVSTFLILQVPGSALQITVAREVSSAVALGHEAPGAGVRRWLGRVAILTLAVTAVAIGLREQLAAAIGVDAEWAAAATLPTGCLWLLASIERGALQGFQRYHAVGLSLIGEALARLGFGLVLVGVGLGVTGAFLGTALSVLGMALVLAIPLRQELVRTASLAAPAVDRFRDLVARAWAPVAGLALLLTLQEVHVIVVKHQASDDAAGAYAAAAVAAKAIIWVAVGLGLYLVPEAARRTKSGVDARPVLVRTLGLIGALALPMVLLYSVAARPLLEIVFGESFGPAAGALPWLGVAMALLACAYLAVQYLLALGKAAFIVVLGIAAAAEPLLLLAIGAQLRDIALTLFGLQLALAVVVLTISFRSAAHPAAPQRPLPAV